MNTIQKINGFSNLTRGWHFGSGVSPTRQTVVLAVALVSFYNSAGFLETNAFPGIDGEIMVAGYLGLHSVQITLEVDGSYTFLHENGEQEEVFMENLGAYELFEQLSLAAKKAEDAQWLTSGSSILYTTSTPSDVNSSISPLGLNRVMMVHPASPALNLNVQYAQVEVRAHTSSGFTETSRRTQRSSGSLLNKMSHPVAA